MMTVLMSIVALVLIVSLIIFVAYGMGRSVFSVVMTILTACGFSAQWQIWLASHPKPQHFQLTETAEQKLDRCLNAPKTIDFVVRKACFEQFYQSFQKGAPSEDMPLGRRFVIDPVLLRLLNEKAGK